MVDLGLDLQTKQKQENIIFEPDLPSVQPEDLAPTCEVERASVLLVEEKVDAVDTLPNSMTADDVMTFSFQFLEGGSGQGNESPEDQPDDEIMVDHEPEMESQALLPRVETVTPSTIDRFWDIFCGVFLCVGDAASAATDGFVLAGQSLSVAIPVIENQLAYRAPDPGPLPDPCQQGTSCWAGQNQSEVFEHMVQGFLSGGSHTPREIDSLPMYEVFEPRTTPQYDRRYEILRGHLPEAWTEMPAVRPDPPESRKTRWLWNPAWRFVGSDYVPPGARWCPRPPDAYERAVGIDQRIRHDLQRDRDLSHNPM